MTNPFDLGNDDAYRDWKARKLAARPARIGSLRVEIANPRAPTAAELARVRETVARANLAIFACERAGEMDATALLGLGRSLGLGRLDSNLCADEQAVSTLTVRAAGRESEYIPYTNRPLSWHTDGYYNPPQAQVGAWMLYCVQDALAGGENALLDHELAYIMLRDEDPELVRALMDPRAMTVPANVENGVELRPESIGPVFSVREGALHMRYTARERNVAWLDTPAVTAARAALARLFSKGGGYIYRHKLVPGEGYVSNNVLHNRSGFDDPGPGHPVRTLLRVRYLDRVSAPASPA